MLITFSQSFGLPNTDCGKTGVHSLLENDSKPLKDDDEDDAVEKVEQAAERLRRVVDQVSISEPESAYFLLAEHVSALIAVCGQEPALLVPDLDQEAGQLKDEPEHNQESEGSYQKNISVLLLQLRFQFPHNSNVEQARHDEHSPLAVKQKQLCVQVIAFDVRR